jgi:uncharacterized alkaline shock family protein YloU
MTDRFDSPGKTTIAPDVLHTIARLTTLGVEGVSRMCPDPAVKMNRIFKRAQAEGVHMEVKDETVFVDLYVIINNNFNIREVSLNIQRSVTRAITEMVGMRVGRVNVHVEDIDYPMETEA